MLPGILVSGAQSLFLDDHPMNSAFLGFFGFLDFSPGSDSYRGSYFQKGGRATNYFGGLDVAPGCHCRVQWTWCHCSVPLWCAVVCLGGVDVV